MRKVYKTVQSASLEVFIAFLCLLSGLPILLNPGVFAPSSVLALLPLPLVFVWGLALVLGGGLTLLGILLSNIYLRRAGLVLLAAAAFVMGICVWIVTGVARFFVSGTFFLFSWSVWSQYRSLSRVLKTRRQRWEREIEKHDEG